MSGVIIGIDLGGTNTKIAVITCEGEVLRRASRPTPVSVPPDAILDFLCDFAKDVVGEAQILLENISAVGVGAPGPLDWRTGLVYTLTNFAGWENVSLAEKMQTRLEGIPCFVENDANAACYGEYWLGAGKGAQNMALLTLGTGVGGGIVLNGELLRGIDGTAGEIGHLIVERDGRECGCGARGCLEAYGSVTGMVRTAREGLERGKVSGLMETCAGDVNAITGQMISECAESGDPFCAEVIRETGKWLGAGIVGLTNLFNPERVVLAGGMVRAGDRLLKVIRETVHADALDVPAKRVEILPAALEDDAGVIGAAGCALARL